MILRDTVTREGRSEWFALYDEPGAATPRWDVHVRIEPSDETVAMLAVYDRRDSWWMELRGFPQRIADRQRIAAEVWKRYRKFVPGEVLS